MRLCFITPRWPWPPWRGDCVRAWHQLRELGRWHEVTLLSLAEEPVEGEARARVAEICSRVEALRLSRARVAWNVCRGLATREPLQVAWYRHPAFQRRVGEVLREGRFDAVHVSLLRMLPCVRGLPGLPPVVVDLVDSLALNLAERRRRARGVWRWVYGLEGERVARYEREVARRFPRLVVSSPEDARWLGGAGVEVLPNGVDVEAFPFQGPQGRAPGHLLFTGNMGYPPNQEAVHWFLEEVWPRVRARWPQACFSVVGARPSESLRALARRQPGARVVGAVPAMSPWLGQASLAVCPLRSGSGIQNKVLEALSTGTPVVATALANRGVGAEPGHHLLVADSAPEFAEAVCRLLGDAALRARLGQAGRALVEARFRWETHARQLSRLYSQAAEAPRARPA